MNQYPICIGKDKRITIIGGINVLNSVDEAIEIGAKFPELNENPQRTQLPKEMTFVINS